MTAINSLLADALRDRYVVERELGHGGMATVYLAHDLLHDRSVALKVLRPDLAQTLGSERFEREIRFAARLQHPHILTVLDSGRVPASGSSAAQLWFTMPHVEGESLRDRLERERRLCVSDAVRIAVETGRALEYAHQHGVIHRDIKPENLLLTSDGSTLVSDFGIARAMTATSERLTETGLTIGTPAYMSPEQASGARQIDGRSDVYALGAVLYEMLVGEPPYTGTTAHAIVAKRLSGAVPGVRHVRPDVPVTLEQVVMKALAPDPTERFASAAEFAQALSSGPTRRPFLIPLLVGVLGVLVLGALGIALWHRRPERVPAALEPVGVKRLAVLPFENLGDSADAYFADGVTDAVRGKLTALPGLQVMARRSTSQYGSTGKSPQQIGRELGVQYLLTGTVRWQKHSGAASRVQVRPELIEVNTAAARWEQAFDASLIDIFEVQRNIAEQVARALNVALGVDQQRMLAEAPTRNLAAYEAFLKGEELSGSGSGAYTETLRRALPYYAQALAFDSSFVMAWVRLAEANSVIYSAGYGELTAGDEAAAARRAADRALALRPNGYEGHLALGSYYLNAVTDYARALDEAAQGLRASPGHPELLELAAAAEMSLGRWDAALEHSRQAQILDPRSVVTARTLGLTLTFLRRYREALTACDHGLALAPTDLGLLRVKGLIYLAEGDLRTAQSLVATGPRKAGIPAIALTTVVYLWALPDSDQQRLLRASPSAFEDHREIWASALAQTHWLRGDRVLARVYADSAREAYETLLQTRHNDYTDALRHTSLGLMWAFLGRKDDAIREARQGVALRPVAKDAVYGVWIERQLARIYVLVGEPDKAVDQLDSLLARPSYLSPAWLRIDPTFAALHGHPRFQELIH